MQRAADEAQVEPGAVSAATSIMKNAGAKIAQDRAELLIEIMGQQGLGWDGEGYRRRRADAPCGPGCGRKAKSIEGGTSEIKLNIVSKRILGLPDPEVDGRLQTVAISVLGLY